MWTERQIDRAMGALLGVALGDALGMPSQTLTPAEIDSAYGWISDFIDPFPDHPVSHGLVAGAVTDDTEQTILLARRIVASPTRFDEREWADALLDWEQCTKDRGLYDLLGPSTKRALLALLDGAPVTETGKTGNTNGAAMRIAPVGISTPLEPLSGFLDRIEITCRVTHNTAEAISAAAAVAAIVSAGVDGAAFDEAIPIALAAAREGGKRGAARGDVDIAVRIETALALAEGEVPDFAIKKIEAEIGTSVLSRHSVVAAFGIVKAARGDPWRAGILSANIGDDTDTIGSIAAGMAAACRGASSIPGDKARVLTTINDLDLKQIASGLLQVRADRASVPAEIEAVV